MASSNARRVHPVFVFAIDLLLVLAFCAIGRASHEEPALGAGFVETAWPFVVGLAGGWALILVRRLRPDTLAAGGVAFAVTVTGGMLLRALSGQGTAVAFVIVAVLTLLVQLVGWRLAWRAARALRGGRRVSAR
ncbi:DUF3054 domain-containing protein [Microbacterium marinilacus]|uniref:DUF3054 domain-containing protein n=1 Tax=Microbacterium marinilacus TaxID=415209 RepID=UPI001C8D227B|nr:DUF3054 domain-containing protein [Microbacterium marinilacus]MBY0687513.1 DUF3054 domain-containing protein [Microbacterium marinilacus]